MKKWLSATLFLLAANLLLAQFGVNAGFKTNGKNDWEKYTADGEFLKRGYKIGVDYWFRLKEYRIEFLPELSFSRFSSDHLTSSGGEQITANSTIYSFNFNTNLYFLDLEGDCNCPTFGKDADLISKGFFLQASPGIHYFSNNFDPTNEANDLVFSIGVGTGLDIGVSNLLTITPMASYHYFFKADWEGLSTITDTEPVGANETSNLQQLFIGLRLGIRLDQQNYGYR